jgi:hypothetical protein
MKEKEEAQERTNEEGGSAEDEEAAAGAQEKHGDGPDEIELLFDGERPEMRKRKSGRSGVVAYALGDDCSVLEVEGKGEKLVMEVEAEEERGYGEYEENAVIEREDAEDAPGVKLAKKSRIGERVVKDSGD